MNYIISVKDFYHKLTIIDYAFTYHFNNKYSDS